MREGYGAPDANTLVAGVPEFIDTAPQGLGGPYASTIVGRFPEVIGGK